MKNSGHKVTIYSYHEDNTVTVNVTGEYNAVVFERHVFGIKPDDLEECDFPDDNEPLGTAITDPNDVKDFIEKTRSVIMKAKNSK